MTLHINSINIGHQRHLRFFCSQFYIDHVDAIECTLYQFWKMWHQVPYWAQRFCHVHIASTLKYLPKMFIDLDAHIRYAQFNLWTIWANTFGQILPSSREIRRGAAVPLHFVYVRDNFFLIMIMQSLMLLVQFVVNFKWLWTDISNSLLATY